MSNEQVVHELKEKSLPVYGTNAEKKNRLKSFHSIPISISKPEKAAKKSTRSAIQQLANNREKRR